ncbi:FadR/GntR family transcriptional regulator, partial [Nostocoides japonicum]|uniref:FadR/GntR family transcriptional regulator n=1 Tax=Nostocoides japonicum TaxID=99481 RepID=UPI00065B855A
LARAIELGLILEGERLPPESQLADELGTATVTLREALATLRERGLVETRRGRGGGTFVRRETEAAARVPRADRDGLLSQRLSGFTTLELRELGDHRRAISATCAALAAERSLDHEVTRLRQRVDVLASARTRSERRRADAQLWLEVAAAAQSSTLAREELGLQARLGDLLWFGCDDADHARAVAQRGRLVTAIASGSGARARALVDRTVDVDTERLVALRLRLYREAP